MNYSKYTCASQNLSRKYLNAVKDCAQLLLFQLFSDIRGFTEFAEGMSSANLTEFLAEFFTLMLAAFVQAIPIMTPMA